MLFVYIFIIQGAALKVGKYFNSDRVVWYKVVAKVWVMDGNKPPVMHLADKNTHAAQAVAGKVGVLSRANCPIPQPVKH